MIGKFSSLCSQFCLVMTDGVNYVLKSHIIYRSRLIMFNRKLDMILFNQYNNNTDAVLVQPLHADSSSLFHLHLHDLDIAVIYSKYITYAGKTFPCRSIYINEYNLTCRMPEPC